MTVLVNTMRNQETRIREQIESLRHLKTGQLKDKYLEVFGEESRSNHKQFHFRRIAWRIQANAWGGISDRARRRALEIANDADLRIKAPPCARRRAPGGMGLGSSTWAKGRDGSVAKAKGTNQTGTRGAIYTRKSTEEGLSQDFNSLDAQREAAEAYIKSQAGEGWRACYATGWTTS